MAELETLQSCADRIDANFIPARCYTDPALTRLENQRVWPRTWHVACREEEVPEVGDYVAFEILDESILVVRTAVDEVTAYYNVCQHRARRLQDEPAGNVRAGFYCPFHGWKYRLDGSLQYATNMEDWPEGVLREKASLKTARTGTWAGWIWVNMDSEALPLLDYLGSVKDVLGPLGIEDMRRHWHKTLIAPVNWKVVVGAFAEAYHAGATHVGGISYRPMKSPAVEYGDHSMYFGEWSGFTKIRDSGSWRDVADLRENIHANCANLHDTLHAMILEPTMRAAERLLTEVTADAPAEAVLERFWMFQREETERIGAKWPPELSPEAVAAMGTGWHIFPGTIFLPTVDGVLWYRLRPYGSDGESCLFDIWSLGRFAPGKEPEIVHEVIDGFDAFRGHNPFLEEDFDSMIAVNKGMRSRGWHGALLNPVQELQIATFMRALHRYIAEDR